jgi:putative copper export protein
LLNYRSVSELRTHPSALRDVPTIAGAATGVAVAGLLMACLLRPELGRYLTEAVALVAALSVAGVAWFATVVPARLTAAPSLRRPTVLLAVVAFAAVLVTLPFAVMAVSGDGLRGLGDGLARAAALRSGDYETVVARGMGLVLVVGGMRVQRGSRALLITGAALITGSFLLMGHVRTHHPEIAVFATTFAHVSAAAAWFGGLLALGLTLRRNTHDSLTSGQLLATFARLMTFVLALLLAAGVGLAILYLPSPGALVHTAYGVVLLVKLAVVASILILSSANHMRLVPAARTGNERAVRVLRANVAAEQVLLLAVLVITEVLMRQNPGG